MKQIFVYGSLRKGMYNYERYLKGKSRFIAKGYVKGTLYTLKDVSYPALIDGNDKVVGEIYEVTEDVLAEIDALEGCQLTSFGEYKKQQKTIYVQNKQCLLDVYSYNLNYKNNRERLNAVISHGDYVRHMQKQDA